MSGNKEILKKADMALADIASAGALNTEQSNKFIRGLIDTPTLLNQARVVGMNSPTMDINKIGIGERIFHAGTENTALTSGQRSKATTSKISLASKEVIAELNLPYAVLEDNIERGNINFGGTSNIGGGASGGGLVDTLLALISQRAALDIEEMALLGDTAGAAGNVLDLFDGYLKRSTSNVVDAGAATINKSMFKNGLKTMPNKYLRNRTALKHFVSVNNEIEYADTLADRATALGDNKIQNANANRAFGSTVESVALMPEAQGLYTDPKNLIVGIQRDLSFEVDKDIRTRQWIVVLTARLDFQIEEEAAIVKYSNIG
jgi:hypothetical protein